MGKWEVKISQRHEKDTEDVWPLAKRTISSGNKFDKGDVKTEESNGIEFRIECKATQNSSYSITKSVWNTIKTHAQNRSYLARPVLAIRFYGATRQHYEWGEMDCTPDNLPVELDLIVMDRDDFLEFYEDYLKLLEEKRHNDYPS